MIYYDRVKPGQWTYYPGTDGSAIIFRKGSKFDPENWEPNDAPRLEAGDPDWLVGSSEWGHTNDDLLDKMLDLLNLAEHHRGESMRVPSE